MHVLVQWEEAGVPRQNPCIHGENMQTPHRKALVVIQTNTPLCSLLYHLKQIDFCQAVMLCKFKQSNINDGLTDVTQINIKKMPTLKVGFICDLIFKVKGFFIDYYCILKFANGSLLIHNNILWEHWTMKYTKKQRQKTQI